MKNIHKSILLFTLLFCPRSALAANYTIDPDHSSVSFKVRHLGISHVKGKFTTFEGSISFDPKEIAASKTTAKIVAKSIDTKQAKRDTHLKSDEFLDVDKFAFIEFKSQSVIPESNNKFKVLGDLTIHGVTKPVTLEVDYGGSVKDPWGNERAAFSATTKIDRKDFGLNWNQVLEAGGLLVGEEVWIDLEIEAIKNS